MTGALPRPYKSKLTYQQGGARRIKYGGIWETAFVLLLVLFAAAAFAGQGHEKRVTIHGKHEDKRAIESLVDDSEDDIEINAGPKTIIKLKGRFKIDVTSR